MKQKFDCSFFFFFLFLFSSFVFSADPVPEIIVVEAQIVPEDEAFDLENVLYLDIDPIKEVFELSELRLAVLMQDSGWVSEVLDKNGKDFYELNLWGETPFEVALATEKEDLIQAFLLKGKGLQRYFGMKFLPLIDLERILPEKGLKACNRDEYPYGEDTGLSYSEIIGGYECHVYNRGPISRGSSGILWKIGIEILGTGAPEMHFALKTFYPLLPDGNFFYGLEKPASLLELRRQSQKMYEDQVRSSPEGADEFYDSWLSFSGGVDKERALALKFSSASVHTYGGAAYNNLQNFILMDLAYHELGAYHENKLKTFFLGLKFLHKKNCVHLDIKITNLVLDYFIPNTIRLIDFGASRSLNTDEDTSQWVTATGHYQSPWGVGYSAKKQDIFSAGLVALFLKYPFQKIYYQSEFENNRLNEEDKIELVEEMILFLEGKEDKIDALIARMLAPPAARIPCAEKLWEEYTAL